MTTLQWHFEYVALLERERSWIKVASNFLSAMLKGCRELLIHTLGLNLIKRWAPAADGTSQSTEASEDACTPFIPGSLIWGQPEVVKHYLEDLEKENVAEAAAADKAFDEWSARLARGDTADMDPILLGETPPGMKPVSTNWQAMLQRVGVRERAPNAPPPETVPHYHVGRKSPAATDGPPGSEPATPTAPAAPVEMPRSGRRPVHIVVED